MEYLRVVVRSCIPLIGIAVIAALYEEPRLFGKVLLLPLAIGFPLIVWLTIKIGSQATANQLIDIKYIIIYGLSLIVIATVVCFCFVLEAIGSHGSYSGAFPTKCLFAFTVIVAIPLVDLILYRSSQIAPSERNHKIRVATILSRLIFLAVAVFSLIWITWPPVNIALRQNHRTLAKILISLGADIHKKDGWGCTPLWYAVQRADPSMMKILLNKGALFSNHLAGLGFLRAIEVDNTDMLKLLLASGANPNSTYMGAHSLFYACLNKRMTMIRILLDSGADINIRASYPNSPWDGKSALDIAREKNDTQMIELLVNHEKKK